MIQTIFLLVLGFFILSSPVFAVSVTISNTPSSITDQPFNIDVSVSGAQAGTNYLRANLFPTGTTKYFGFTNNGTTFVNGSDYSQYFSIPIDSSGNWSDTIQAKLDIDSSYYTGAGTYSLKVRRYTQSGSSYTWSNEVTLNINFATPSPTPAPTPIPSPTPTPVPSSTPIPKKITTQTISTQTPTPTTIPSPKNTPVAKANKEYNSPTPAFVAGASSSATTSAQVSVKNQKQVSPMVWIGLIFIFAGASSLGYIYWKKR